MYNLFFVITVSWFACQSSGVVVVIVVVSLQLQKVPEKDLMGNDIPLEHFWEQGNVQKVSPVSLVRMHGQRREVGHISTSLCS